MDADEFAKPESAGSDVSGPALGGPAFRRPAQPSRPGYSSPYTARSDDSRPGDNRPGQSWRSVPDADTDDATQGDYDLADRHSLRRVASLSTELADVTEVEYRQLRLERVVLVGVWTEGSVTDAENSLAELAALAETAGSLVLEGLIQRRSRPDAATFVGRGKVEEVREVVLSTGADTVICDGELSPSQLRALESQVKVKVIDRTALILDIFAQHATSKRARRRSSWPSSSTSCRACVVGVRRCPGRAAAPAVVAVPAAAWACVAPVKPRSKPTGAGSVPASPSSSARSRRWVPSGRPSAPAAGATRSRRWPSPATPTPASRAC
jgi:hypothetical protein